MNYSTCYELESIKSELDSIISELSDISWGVRNDFVGIGSDKCANTIDGVIEQYKGVKRRLNNIDTSVLTESFKQAHGIED